MAGLITFEVARDIIAYISDASYTARRSSLISDIIDLTSAENPYDSIFSSAI